MRTGNWEVNEDLRRFGKNWVEAGSSRCPPWHHHPHPTTPPLSPPDSPSQCCWLMWDEAGPETEALFTAVTPGRWRGKLWPRWIWPQTHTHTFTIKHVHRYKHTQTHMTAESWWQHQRPGMSVPACWLPSVCVFDYYWFKCTRGDILLRKCCCLGDICPREDIVQVLGNEMVFKGIICGLELGLK